MRWSYFIGQHFADQLRGDPIRHARDDLPAKILRRQPGLYGQELGAKLRCFVLAGFKLTQNM
jgi:hypothetical protein